MKAYVKRLKNGLAQLPADVKAYFESGDAGEEIRQWWKETNDYISNGGLLKDIKDAAIALPKELIKSLFKGETYKGLAHDMTIGMLADIEAFATGIDPRTGKKINLPNRIDSLVQSFAKPAKIVKKVKAFDKIIDKLSIKKLDGKNSGKGKNSSATNGDKVQKAGGNQANGSKGKDSSERKKEAPLLDAPAAGDNIGNQLRNGKDSGDGKNGNGSSNGNDSEGGKDSGKDSSGGKKDGDKGTGKAINGFEAKVHPGKQGKHIPSHSNYQEGKSIFTGNAQTLLDKYAGKGEWIGQNKERVNFNQVIGKWVDPTTGRALETTKGIIHYSKNGAHIVPARP